MTLRPQGLVTLRKRLLAGSEAVTIAIGLLCDGGNSILLSADTMISYGSVTSNQGGSKIYDLPLGLFAAVADDISSTQLFIGKLTEELKTITVGDPAFVDKVKIAMQSACADSLVSMRSDILSFVGITENEFLHDKKLVPSLRRRAEKLLRKTTLPIEVIIAGYCGDRGAFFYSDGLTITEQTSPGIHLAGSGADAARHWFGFRQQNVHFSRARSYAHLVEALTFARLSAFVGSRTGALLLHKGVEKPTFLTNKGQPWVDDLRTKIWLRPTDYLDAPDEVSTFDQSF